MAYSNWSRRGIVGKKRKDVDLRKVKVLPKGSPLAIIAQKELDELNKRS